MKLPNLRLYETQAQASLVLSVLALVGTLLLALFVFKGFDAEQKIVVYNPEGGFGVLRRPLVFGGSAMVILVGGTAGILGFNSLGQKRNKKQGLSWLGMCLGALAVAIAPILFYAWRVFSEPIIQNKAA
jgi:hypothetical protein